MRKNTGDTQKIKRSFLEGEFELKPKAKTMYADFERRVAALLVADSDG